MSTSSSGANCLYCYDAPPQPEQFYETKLFRVLIARRAFATGHIIIMPKRHDPHFYSFTPDDIDEFGYLVKKVSFWSMRWVQASGFSLVMNDSTPESQLSDHLEVHIIPRRPMDTHFSQISVEVSQALTALDDQTIQQGVQELQNLMQLPQATQSGEQK